MVSSLRGLYGSVGGGAPAIGIGVEEARGLEGMAIVGSGLDYNPVAGLKAKRIGIDKNLSG